MRSWRFLVASILLSVIGMGIFYRNSQAVGDGLVPKSPSPLPQIGRFQIAGIPSHIYVLDTATGQVWHRWDTPSSSSGDSKDFLEPKIKTAAQARGPAALEDVSALQRELKKLRERVGMLEQRLAKRPKPKGAAEPEPRYEGKPLNYWMQMMQDRSSAFRAKAALALGKIGPKAKASIPMLLDALKDSIPEVRAAAARGLGGIGAREAIPALREALKDKESEVRLGVVEGLGGMKGAAGVVVPVLLQAFEDPQPGVAYEAFVSLGKLGPEAKTAVPELIRRAKGPKSGWKSQALETLQQIAPEEADKIPEQPN